MEKKTDSSFIEIIEYLNEIDELLKKTDEEEQEIADIVKTEMEKVLEREHIESDRAVRRYEETLIKKYKGILHKRRIKLENVKNQLKQLAVSLKKPMLLS